LFDFQIVFNDAVVHDNEFAGAIAVRMRVFFGRTAVRGPARVPDAVGAFERRLGEHFVQIAQLASGAANFDFAGAPVGPVQINHGDTGRVISAVLQLAQTLDDNRNDFFRADVAHDSAHAAGS